VNLRHEIEQQILEQTPVSAELNQASWWANTRDSGGLRLSGAGYEIFSRLEGYQGHEFNLEVSLMNGRNLLALDRYLTCPYHIGRRLGRHHILTLFGSKEAMMATLYGDVERFIASLGNAR